MGSQNNQVNFGIHFDYSSLEDEGRKNRFIQPNFGKFGSLPSRINFIRLEGNENCNETEKEGRVYTSVVMYVNKLQQQIKFLSTRKLLDSQDTDFYRGFQKMIDFRDRIIKEFAITFWGNTLEEVSQPQEGIFYEIHFNEAKETEAQILETALLKATKEQSVDHSTSFENKDLLSINASYPQFYKKKRLPYIEVSYGEYAQNYLEDGQDAYLMTGSENYPLSESFKAVGAFLYRKSSEKPWEVTKAGYSIDEIFGPDTEDWKE